MGRAAVVWVCLLMVSGIVPFLTGSSPFPPEKAEAGEATQAPAPRPSGGGDSAASPGGPGEGNALGEAGILQSGGSGTTEIRGGWGDGIRSLVSSPPWSGYKASDPFTPLNRSRHPQKSPLAITGSEKVLIVLVNFNDTTNSSTHTPKYYDDLIFNASQNSMNRFFKDNSYDLFCITGNVTSKWYSASKSEAYYGTYEFWNPRKAGYGNAQDLVYEAVNAADADINFSEYDQNADGYVDHLVVVHAGKDDANDGDFTGPDGDPQTWSHAWGLNALAVKLDGVWCNEYTMLSEESPVGTFSHEFGHDLGLPDLYDTDYSSDGGVGDWDIMASGSWNNNGKTPAQLSAWCKQELGWLTPTLVSADSSGLTAKRVEDNSSGAVYKVWVNFSNNEYFLVENRQQTGWDAYLPGSGLLIWHINETASSNRNDRYRIVDLEEADNDNDTTEATDPWKSSSTGFTPTTSPNSNDYSGKSTGIRVYNISASGNSMTFDVALGNTAPNAPTPTAPADNSWSNQTRPTLSWTFSDPNNWDSQTAYRVQVDGDSAFGSVDWDSGEVVSASSSCTVGQDLGDGKWYWRVRTRDTGGLWGAFNSGGNVRGFNIDTIAPAAPPSVTATPGGWSATDSFSVDWTVPSESGTSTIVTGVYYKLDAAPASATDGTWSGSKPLTGLSVTSSGVHTLYIWLKDGVGNVNHQNRSSVKLYLDTVPPANPTSVTSPTHALSAWSNLGVIGANWSGASDSDSGVDGFSYVWDGNPGTLPDSARDCGAAVATNTSPSLADGTYYFHIRTVDAVGNWAAAAVHLGPFFIDLTPPQGVQGAASTSHQVDVWSNRSEIKVQWWGDADPGGSGVGGYSLSWDRSPDTLPDDDGELASGNSATSPVLPDAAGYYFHIRVRDAVGNWNSTALHLGPFDLDATPPANPAGFEVLSNNTLSVWCGNRVVEVAWSGFSDALAGVDGFAVLWDKFPATLPPAVKDLEENHPYASSQKLPTGQYYLHLRTRDNAGNWNGSALHIGPFLVDADRPSAPAARDGGDFSGSATIGWSWSPASDPLSGVAGYFVSVGLVKGGSEVVRDAWTADTGFSLDGAMDGLRYFLHVRAVDRAGNLGEWGEPSDGILVDLGPPLGLFLVINGGADLTSDPKVRLTVQAFDGLSGVSEMRFSQGGREWGDWMPFSDSHQLNLTGGDGLRLVLFQARDLVGNAAEPAGAAITLDTSGPEITSLEVTGGATVVRNPSLRIQVEATDALSRPAQVRLSADGSSWEGWQPYGRLVPWELEGPDGPKEVFAQARDSAGNAGPAASLKVFLDTKAPGKPVTSSSTHPRSDVWYASLVLRFGWAAPADASDIAGYSYLLTPDAKDQPWPYVMTTATALEVPVPGEGRWHFRIRAVDGAGNWGEAADHLVLIDTRGPSAPGPERPESNAGFLPGDTVELAWSAARDPGSGVKGYRVQLAGRPDFSSPVVDQEVGAAGYSLSPLPEGSYFWRVAAVDGAGNWGDYTGPGAFDIRKPARASDEPGKPGFFDRDNPLFLLIVGVLLLAIVGGTAAAVARRRRRRPPVPETPPEAGAAVQWEQ